MSTTNSPTATHVEDLETGRDGNKGGAVVSELGTGRWWTDEEERQVRRKVDLNVLPLMFVLYALAFLDRSNIGNAKVQLVPDLGFSDSQFQWLLTIFYIAYILFQWCMIFYAIFPPRKFVAICVFFWGLASTLQATAYNWSGMMAARFFMGIFEAAWSTGVAFFFTTLFTKKEIGFRFAIFVSGSAVASAFAGALAYGLLQTNTAIAPWRLLFVIEGAPTILMAPFVWFFLPDDLSSARFLSDRERKIALCRLAEQEGDLAGSADGAEDQAAEGKGALAMSAREKAVEEIKAKFNPRAGIEAFKEPLAYCAAALYFLLNCSYSSLPIYLPTILQGLGYSSINAQGYSAPPYVCAFVVALTAAFVSDRTGYRGTPCIFMATLAAVGYIILGTSTEDHTRYGACFMVAIGLFSFIPLVIYWLLLNQSNKSKRGVALAILGTTGQCGTILGTRLFPAKDGPRYQRGFFVCGSLLFFAALLVCVSLGCMLLSNARKEKRCPLKAGLSPEQEREKQRDIAANGEKSDYYRWTL
ncbi:hypothetical protein OC835_003110 [Tilletia horrida]|nr:hypothetical protein OC835_003110 [Tilletia horrida]